MLLSSPKGRIASPGKYGRRAEADCARTLDVKLATSMTTDAAISIVPANEAKSPGHKLDRLFLGYLDWIKGDRQTRGCLFITAIQEFDDRPGSIHDRLVSSQNGWRQLLAATTREAIASGEISPKDDIDLFVFELIGTALAYQHALKLFRDRQARTKAERAYAKLKAHS